MVLLKVIEKRKWAYEYGAGFNKQHTQVSFSTTERETNVQKKDKKRRSLMHNMHN